MTQTTQPGQNNPNQKPDQNAQPVPNKPHSDQSPAKKQDEDSKQKK